jgi:flagellar M-ring protein FliF
VNYQRALEGELARTIETLGPVKSARVHLAMPKPSYLSVNRNPLQLP